jgi:hypothetical protein
VDVSTLTSGFELQPAAIDGKLTLPVTPQQQTVTFRLTPVNNTVINEGGNETIVFSMASVSEGLVIGQHASLEVTIMDDETPALANFVIATASVRENKNDGIPVVISLTHAAPGAATITLSLESTDVTYGEDYITAPEAINGTVTLTVATGADQVSFQILPINDSFFNGNRNIHVSLESAEGPAYGQPKENSLIIWMVRWRR